MRLWQRVALNRHRPCLLRRRLACVAKVLEPRHWYLEKWLDSTGGTNSVNTVAVTKPPTITVARGFGISARYCQIYLYVNLR